VRCSTIASKVVPVPLADPAALEKTLISTTELSSFGLPR